MKIVLDLDGTICSLRKEWQDYVDVVPNFQAVEKIQKLKEQGHYIIIQTARHMETCSGNIGKVNAKIAKKTLDWLEKYNIPYDEIFFGKPNGDIYLDDNAMRFTGWNDIQDIENYEKDLINIVIPMAWAWSRFVKAWYELPKPLIDVKWKTMLEWAVSSFKFLEKNYKLVYIFVILKEHIGKHSIDKFILEKYQNSKIIILDSITRGQAETVYKAKNYINDYNKLIIYNADTYSDYSLDDFPIWDESIDWIIPCFKANDPRYSFVKLDKYWYACELAEKKVISDNASNWLYYFRRWKDFIYFAEQMIEKSELSWWEFYVAPLYNSLIKVWKRIIISPVKENWVLWTPEELNYFLENYKNV